jgi:hypothetical protein
LYQNYAWKIKGLVEKDKLTLADFKKYIYRHALLACDYLDLPEDKELAMAIKTAMRDQIGYKDRLKTKELLTRFVEAIETDGYDLEAEQEKLFTIFNIERAT